MRSIYAIAALLSAAAATSAGARSGVDDTGKCVSPCSREGGRPCPPCLPSVGPGQPGWDAAVDDYEHATDAYLDNVLSKAARDREYRESEQFDRDKDVYEKLSRSVDAMHDLSDPETRE